MKINEIVSNDYMLSDYQKEVLLLIALSATPRQAYDSTVGNDNIVTARNLLIKLGFVNYSNNQLMLTDTGQDALISFNLIDDTGQPTPEGVKYLKNKQDELNLTGDENSF